MARSGTVIPAQAGISQSQAQNDVPQAQNGVQAPTDQTHWVYILTNTYHNVLYIGSTKAPARRVAEHIRKNKDGFSARYNTTKLVYLETQPTLEEALKRERQLKKWNREWKENLIKGTNPGWKDLYKDHDHA